MRIDDLRFYGRYGERITLEAWAALYEAREDGSGYWVERYSADCTAIITAYVGYADPGTPATDDEPAAYHTVRRSWGSDGQQVYDLLETYPTVEHALAGHRRYVDLTAGSERTSC